MKLSLYTAVKNGIYYDFHVVAMLKHHLPLADEIIVNEGYSTDDTLRRISDIDPKIKIFQSEWETQKDNQPLPWSIEFKDTARRRCGGDWCILLDCDEFIPEWQFEGIRKHLEHTDDIMIPVKFVNFYGNFHVYHSRPETVNWPARKIIIHRNLPDIEVWGDGSNVKLKGRDFRWDTSEQEFAVHHFGFVRNSARLREKWSAQGRAAAGQVNWFEHLGFLFNLRPHRWLDSEFSDSLAIYNGPHIKAVRNDPKEFVRDGLDTYKHLLLRGPSGKG